MLMNRVETALINSTPRAKLIAKTRRRRADLAETVELRVGDAQDGAQIGVIGLPIAVLAHELSELAVMGNGTRLARA